MAKTKRSCQRWLVLICFLFFTAPTKDGCDDDHRGHVVDPSLFDRGPTSSSQTCHRSRTCRPCPFRRARTEARRGVWFSVGFGRRNRRTTRGWAFRTYGSARKAHGLLKCDRSSSRLQRFQQSDGFLVSGVPLFWTSLVASDSSVRVAMPLVTFVAPCS